MSVRGEGYAIASVAELGWTNGGAEPVETDERASTAQLTLAEELGCTHTGVDAFRLPSDGSFDLPPGREQVVVSAPAEPAPDEGLRVLSLADCEFELPASSTSPQPVSPGRWAVPG